MYTAEHRRENVVQVQKMFRESSDSEQQLNRAMRHYERRTMKMRSELRDYLIEQSYCRDPIYCRLNGDRDKASSE